MRVEIMKANQPLRVRYVLGNSYLLFWNFYTSTHNKYSWDLIDHTSAATRNLTSKQVVEVLREWRAA